MSEPIEENKPLVLTAEGDLKIINDDKELKALVAENPVVVDDAITAHEEKQAEIKSNTDQAANTIKDRQGRAFNPDLHETGPDGKPVFTSKSGAFKKKPGSGKLNLPGGINAQGGVQAAQIDPLRVEAEQYTDMLLLGARALIGDEALPEPGERDSQVSAWHAVFLKYGSIPINPWCGIALVYGGYIGKRVSRPKTQTVLGAIKDFFVNLYLKVTGKGYTIKTDKKNENRP